MLPLPSSNLQSVPGNPACSGCSASPACAWAATPSQYLPLCVPCCVAHCVNAKAVRHCRNSNVPFVSLSIRTRGTCSTPPHMPPPVVLSCETVRHSRPQQVDIPTHLEPSGANLPGFQVDDRFPVVAVPRPQIQMPGQVVATSTLPVRGLRIPHPRSTNNLRATLAMDVAWICAARSVGVVAS